MIKPVHNTNPTYIHFLDCNPGVNRRIVFDGCKLSIIEGVQTLAATSLCDFQLEGLSGGTIDGGCGGSTSKKTTILPKSNYTLVAPEIGQAQGEVQLIVIKVKYNDKVHKADQYLTWEYKGSIYSINTLMILSGRTKADQPWQGWDLSGYGPTPSSPPNFSPSTFPEVNPGGLEFGGILFYNPSEYEVDLEILIYN